MGFVANDLQSPEASSKFPFLSITIQKYQGRIPESTSQSEARYFSFSTAYRSALAGFRKEVIGKGSPDCSSLSLSVTSLLTLHVLKPSTAKEAESQHLTQIASTDSTTITEKHLVRVAAEWCGFNGNKTLKGLQSRVHPASTRAFDMSKQQEETWSATYSLWENKEKGRRSNQVLFNSACTSLTSSTTLSFNKITCMNACEKLRIHVWFCYTT